MTSVGLMTVLPGGRLVEGRSGHLWRPVQMDDRLGFAQRLARRSVNVVRVESAEDAARQIVAKAA